MKKVLFPILALVLALGLAVPMAASVVASPGPGIAGLWHLDEGSGKTAYDNSGLGNDGTLSGGRFGGALSFDGLNDYVDVGAAVDDDITTAVTLEAWIKPAVKQRGGVISNDVTYYSPHKGYDFFLWDDDTYGRLYIDFGNGSALGRTYWNIPGLGWYGNWHHVAATWDGSNIRLYVDGDEKSTLSYSGSYSDPGKSTFIGAINLGSPGSPIQHFNGTIDEVRVSNVVRYTTGFTPSTTPFSPHANTVGLWHFDGNANDSSGNTNHGTVYGASWVPAGPTWTAGMFGNALDFDGSDDYVEVPDSTTLEPSTITVEAWVKNSGIPGPYKYIVSKYYAAKYGGWCSYAFYTGGFGGLRFYIGSTSSWVGSPWIGNSIWDGNWHHIAGTFDGSKVRLYVDGSEVGTGTSTTQSIAYDTGDLFIGAYVDFASGWRFPGIIDEVRIWDQALTADQVEASYDLRNGTQIKEKDLGTDGYPDIIFTSAFYELDDSDPITLTILPVDSSVGITDVTINRVTPNPKRTYGSITPESVSASGYSVPVTVYNIHATKPPCKTIHMWLWLSTGDHVGVNAQFQR